MAELKINCPGCDQHLSVPEELAGQQIDCPSCSKPMTVPAFAEVDEDDEEWWVEESTSKSSKLIVGIAAGITMLGVVAFLTISGNPEELADANPVNPPVENPTTEKLSSTPKQQAKTATDIDNKLFDLISKSALISRGNTTGETVLKEAKTLLEKGANVNAIGNFRKASPLYMAAYHDSKEMTELLLNNGADVHQIDYSGETPLHTAAYHGRGKTDVVVLLVKNGADVNAKESSGKTALHWAVSQEQTNIARFLIESGADVNAEITSGLEKGKTALDMVSILGNMNGMRELLTSNGAKKGKNRRVPAGTLGGNMMMPGMMNPYGMMGMGMPLPESPTAFELATAEILPLLLAKVPETLLPKALEEEGEVSLLRKALAKRDLAKAKLLIERGANVNHPIPGTEPAKPDLGNLDDPGSPLGQGMLPGMMPGMGMGMPGMNPYGMMMPGMMGMGMTEDTNKVELAALSVVSQAARVGDWAFFQLVMDRGADPKRSEPDGSTPLHHAAANTDGAILKHLLTQQPDLEARDDADRTAAAHAAQAGLLENVRLLEQAGANLNDSNLVNAAIRSLDTELVAHLIDSAKKPLDENWNRALPELEEIIRPEDFSGEPGNPIGMMNPMMMGMGMMPGKSPAKSLTEEDLATTRAIATLLLENGLTSDKLKTPADIANLTRAKPEAGSNE